MADNELHKCMSNELFYVVVLGEVLHVGNSLLSFQTAVTINPHRPTIIPVSEGRYQGAFDCLKTIHE